MILIIDNYDSFTYNLFQLVAQCEPNTRVIRNDQATLAEIKAMAPKGIILSPGPGRPEDAGICIDLIKNLDSSVPLLGVCLGHQAIAKAFGGNVVGAQQIVHGKKAAVFHRSRELYQGMPLPFQAARYHSLMIDPDTLPDCLEVDAENDEGMIMGVRHKTLPIYGVQFHPESILTVDGKKIVNNFMRVCGI